MATGRKQIAFDLDTKALRKYYPSYSWNSAYDVIKRHMQNNGFTWQQGSVYVSTHPMSLGATSNIIFTLIQNNPWLNLCMRDCRQTNIGKEHSQNHLFDREIDLPARAEIKTKKQKTATIDNIYNTFYKAFTKKVSVFFSCFSVK